MKHPYRDAPLTPPQENRPTIRGKLRTLKRRVLVAVLAYKPICHVCNARRHRSRMEYHGGDGGPMRFACRDRSSSRESRYWGGSSDGKSCLSISRSRKWS